MSASTSRIPRLLRVREVSAATGLEKFRIYAAIRSGDMPAMRIGRTYRIPEDALAEWIREQSRQADR